MKKLFQQVMMLSEIVQVRYVEKFSWFAQQKKGLGLHGLRVDQIFEVKVRTSIKKDLYFIMVI